jgi:hypothetical protein
MTRQEFKRKFCDPCEHATCRGIDDAVCRFACEKYKQVQGQENIKEEELLEMGWHKEDCKIGTLYFYGQFFGSLKDGELTLFHQSQDMTPIGRAKSIAEITPIIKDYFVKEANSIESILYIKRSTTSRFYGKCNFNYNFEMRAFKKVLDAWHDSNFDPSVDWEQKFRDALDEEYGNYELGKRPVIGK